MATFLNEYLSVVRDGNPLKMARNEAIQLSKQGSPGEVSE